MRSALPPRPPLLDTGLAALAVIIVSFGTIGANTAQQVTSGPDVAMLGCAVLAAAALAWRRAAPLFGLGCVVVVVAAYLAAGYAFGPILLCVVLAMFETARNTRWHVSLLACASAATVMVAMFVLREIHTGGVLFAFVLAWGGWLVIPWSLGALAHVRANAVARERSAVAERAKLAERTRLAREVHDIAGHGLSAIAMQAGVALVVLDEDTAQARRCVAAIQSTSTRALNELRTMLDAVHPSGPGESATAAAGESSFDTARTVERAEPPAVSAEGSNTDLDELLETFRAAGVRVALRRATSIETLSVAPTAYRVVREALTNVLRHAGTKEAVVSVERAHGVLRVEIVDFGAGANDIGESGRGRGIGGMRARVEAVGGTLDVGNRAEGGFRVTARLPVSEE